MATPTMPPTRLGDVEWYIAQLEKGRSGRQFEGPDFFRPYHFAMTACAVHRYGATELTVSPRIEGYASRMHLWQSIGLETPRAVNEKNPGGRFHPLAPITSEASAEELSFGVLDVFRGQGTSDKTTLQAISTALSEIFGNAHFHSGLKGQRICGLACAQAWPGRNLAQVAIADIGMGIRESLKGNPRYDEELRTANASEFATRLGVTGKPDGPHSGYGLTVARQLMERHNGRCLVLSGDEAFCADGRVSQARKLPMPWVGTIVVLEWNTTVPLNVGVVYSSWPKTGDDLDEFF